MARSASPATNLAWKETMPPTPNGLGTMQMRGGFISQII
jgi:hypothetical protein